MRVKLSNCLTSSNTIVTIFSELQDLKKQVVQSIKSNNELEEALNIMDIKIGLLVKNRITLQVR